MPASPIALRLGIKEGDRVLLLDPPVGFARGLEPLPEGAGWTTSAKGMQDVVILFAASHAALTELFHRAAHHIAPRGQIWAAWPRKSSGFFTDLTEDLVRAIGHASGFVDNKLISFDEVWSGLRFIFKERDRLIVPKSAHVQADA